MLISVLVLTSPGREAHLERCLTMLTHQSCQDFETIVVDDGSCNGSLVGRAFARQFPLTYHWRPNDRCLSRSRNIGARLAQGDYLVFIDSDILLNPGALAAYRQYAQDLGEAVVYGYFGYHRESYTPSAWFPSILVQWLDVRFEVTPQRGLVAYPPVLNAPFRFAWGGNFGLTRRTFDQLSGFDERFIGWGAEDLDFSCRAILNQIPLYFSLDAWGEHQIHHWRDAFHLVSGLPQHKQYKDAKLKELLSQVGESEAFYQPGVLQGRQAEQLHVLIQTYYSRFE